MGYCFNCGAHLPGDGANFCPSCGADLRLSEVPQQESHPPEKALDQPSTEPAVGEGEAPPESPATNLYGFVKRLAWRDWISVFTIFLIVIVVIISLGASTPLVEEDGANLLEEFQRLVPEPSAFFILSNNLRAAYLMMIPAVGLIVGPVAMYNTGMVLSVAAAHADTHGLWLLLGILLTPFAWLEFFAYSAAMTQGVFLIRGFLKHRKRLSAPE
jgi:hypothetical protein